MDLFPAIDLQNGACVRLVKGDFASATLYERDPLTQAARFRAAGAHWLHVVDLDGARDGTARQTTLVQTLAAESGLRVQTGGGLRDAATIEALLKAGVERVVIGSLAVKNPALVKAWLRSFGGGKIVLALDIRRDSFGHPEVLVDGWQKGGGRELDACLADFVDAGATTVLCTDVARDGLLVGANDALYARLASAWPTLAFLASGGVSGPEDLPKLKKAGCRGVVIGKALYEGKIDLAQALREGA
jgi:phosphoribosylformimino-5-aminoimidazole carboxamide ribotide isomerase